MEKPYVRVTLVCNLAICVLAIVTIGLLEWKALTAGIDGVAMSLSVGTIGLIVGVKGKDILAVIRKEEGRNGRG
jgi:hypothetical protein